MSENQPYLSLLKLCLNEKIHIIPATIKIKRKDKNIKKARENLLKIINTYDSLLKQLSLEYDYILLDCAPGFDLEAIATLHVAGALLIVTNPDYPSIVTAAKAIEYAKRLKVPVGGLILNKVENKRYELKSEEIEKALKIKIIQKIPFDKKIPKSIAHRRPLILFKPRSKASKAYNKLAEIIVGNKKLKKKNFFKKLKFKKNKK